MKSSSCALAAVLVALAGPAAAQYGDGPVRQMTSPPTIYSSSPSTAVRQMSPALPPPMPSIQPRPPAFAPALAAPSTRLPMDAREERRFLREAAAQSRFELDASQLAFSKSANGNIRKLAAALINHNKTAVLELQHLLNSRGMALPMISNEQRKALNQLVKFNGSRFDALYMEQVGLRQGAVAREYEKAAAGIREPQILGWIQKTLPTMRYHMTMAGDGVPADPQVAKWNRAVIKPGLVKPQPGIAVQPIAATVPSGFSGSGNR